MLQKIIALANLSVQNLKLLQNIRNLRNSFFNEHYNKNNITFKGAFDQALIKIIHSALEKADIPFKVSVVDKLFGANVTQKLAGIGCGLWRNLKFSYHRATESAAIKENTLDACIYINPYLNSQNSLIQKAVFAHEVTYLLNLHFLQAIFIRAFIEKEKKVDAEILNECMHILAVIHEYQADILPLANYEYALAQNYFFGRGISRSDIYVAGNKMIKLSARAIALHKAEQELKSSTKKVSHRGQVILVFE